MGVKKSGPLNGTKFGRGPGGPVLDHESIILIFQMGTSKRLATLRCPEGRQNILFEGVCLCILTSSWFERVVPSLRPAVRDSVSAGSAESAGSAGSAESADEFPDRTFSQQYWASKIDRFGTRIAP